MYSSINNSYNYNTNSCKHYYLKTKSLIWRTGLLDFAVVAKIKTKEDGEEKEESAGKKASKTTCSRGQVMQALRQKLNGFIFSEKNPTYYKGMHFNWSHGISNWDWDGLNF